MKRVRLPRKLPLSVMAVADLVAILAQPASAHTGAATIGCTTVAFTLDAGSGFISGTVTVNETASIDWALGASGSTQVTNDGGASSTLPITVSAGRHTLMADASIAAQGELVGSMYCDGDLLWPDQQPSLRVATRSKPRRHTANQL
jgi:hypothetical protein